MKNESKHLNNNIPADPRSGESNKLESEVPASILAELLFYHAALGGGYNSPFPPMKGLVFTSALPDQAIVSLNSAEKRFLSWHFSQLDDTKQMLERMKAQPKSILDDPATQAKIKQLEEKVSGLPFVTWRDERLSKADMIDMLKKSYYSSYTYFDAAGGRLAGMLCNHSRMLADMTLHTLTEGTVDQMMIRSSGTGGTNIQSLATVDPVFNFFSSAVDEEEIDHLRDRIQNSRSGKPGRGHCILIPGSKSVFTGTTADVLHDLMMKVYVKGELEPAKRVNVAFSEDSRQDWTKFLNWSLKDLIEEEELAEWHQAIAAKSPVTPQLAVLFGARAAMVNAFLEAAEGVNRGGPINEVVLEKEHLSWAMRFARSIYVRSSGHDKFVVRVANLRRGPGPNQYASAEKLAKAKEEIEEAILNAEGGRLSRTAIRRNLKNATLGLLDELVKKGEIVELQGTEQCRMGKTTRAYTLPYAAPGIAEDEAFDEFMEASEQYAEDPNCIADRDVFEFYTQLQRKAMEFSEQHFLPVVPLSRMTAEERRALPRIIDMFPGSVLLRGKDHIPEPEHMLDEDTPLDIDGCNLWMRYRPDSKPFVNDWNMAGRLALGQYWGKDDEEEEAHNDVSAGISA
jgi:hypothetical protein